MGLDWLLDSKHILDGGYISWNFGLGEQPIKWFAQRIKYMGGVIVVDDQSQHRIDVYADYKNRRKDKKAVDPVWAMKAKNVARFRTNFLLNDTMMFPLLVKGYEADDIIALMHLHNTYWGSKLDYQIISEDKDYRQCPNFGPHMYDRYGQTTGDRAVKSPKYAIQPMEPWEWSFYQMMFGDKSDSIPRLLPSHPTRAKELWAECFNADSPLSSFNTAFALIGDDAIRNLHLVLMPSPNLRSDWNELKANPSILLQTIASEQYWDYRMFDMRFVQSIDDMHTEWESKADAAFDDDSTW